MTNNEKWRKSSIKRRSEKIIFDIKWNKSNKIRNIINNFFNCANQLIETFKDMFQVCPWKWLRRSALRTSFTSRRLHMKQLVLHASIIMTNASKFRHIVIVISKNHYAESQLSPDCCFFKKERWHSTFFYCMHSNQTLLIHQQASDTH